MVKQFLLIFVGCLHCLCGIQAEDKKYNLESVLNKGSWVKFRIEKTGIYKISYPELKKMGFSNPAKVSVHGYGGWPLDEDFTKEFMDDLPATAIWRGENYLLFYGVGPVKWDYDSNKGRFIHTNNPYSDYGVYFLTDSGYSKEMELEPLIKGEASLTLTTFDDYMVYEKDLVSVNRSGRELYGESLYSGSWKKLFGQIEGITDEAATIDCRMIAKTFQSNQMTLSVNGEKVASGSVPVLSSSTPDLEYVRACEAEVAGVWNGRKQGDLNLQLSYSEKSNNSAYLDYIRISMKRSLQVYDEPYTFFRSVSSVGNQSRFQIAGVDRNLLVFDVTDRLNPKRMEIETAGGVASFSITSQNKLREFVLVQPEKAFPEITATQILNVNNQNLHGYHSVEMVIISPESFREEAERLKKAHVKHDDFDNEADVVIVSPEEIYNEFSSGTPDATAYRRFMKMFYDRDVAKGTNKLNYLLLLGDGAYDNRFLTDDWKKFAEKENMLLTYQTQESLNYYSYPVDDYFGFLGDETPDAIFRNEGGYVYSDADMKIGIGRFPVRTKMQAATMVDKVISYMENTNPGLWKNELCFVADDGSNSDSFATYHQTDADGIAEYVEATSPEYILTKIYFDAYKKTQGENGIYPDVATEIKKKLNNGLFLINYTGHGGTEGWSDEKVLVQNNILQLNYNHLPVWITATCDFCRFDDYKTSAGEDVFLNAKGGGIALFTTSRVAYPAINKKINTLLINNLFPKENNSRLTLGEVMRRVKNGNSDGRKLSFCLIGDPALHLSYPRHRIRLTAINGKNTVGEVCQFKALEKITLEGEIITTDGTVLPEFNGMLSTKIMDGRQTVETLGNNSFNHKIKYEDYKNTIFIGTSLVENGKFKFSFIVPKDISYSSENRGKISLYASDESTREEAQGYFNNFTAYGTADNLKPDTVAPEIRALFLNDSTFTSGGKVNTTPYFYVRLWDQSGINITGNSPGHDIMLNIDNNPACIYVLNNYYENRIGQEGEGIVKFGIPKLAAGKHTAEFKVWDIMNNVQTVSFMFEVVEGLKPYLMELKATPVPARENVSFFFTHNRPDCRMKIGILVYDMAGRLLWKHEESGSSGLFQQYEVDWDLTNSSGSRIRPGIYLYRAAISTDNSKEATETERIVVLSN